MGVVCGVVWCVYVVLWVTRQAGKLAGKFNEA